MQQIFDRQGTGACAKGTLSRLTRTGGLLMGAVLSGMLLVDLPIPVGRADAPSSAPRYVPAADSWIEPGAASRHEAPHKASAVIPAEPAHHADQSVQQKKLRRKPRASRNGVRPASTRLSGRSERWRKGV